MIDEAAIRLRWDTVGSQLDERGRRLFAAAEVRSAGRGGLALVSKITGLARSTINRGEDDLDAEPLAKGRVRRAGGGRRAVSQIDPGLVPALKRLVEPATLGDPMRPLIWVSKSMEKLAAALTEMGHPISADTVRTELVKLGFSRQSNRKANEGSSHPDRNAQFDHINAKVVAAQAQRQPVISVDTKKKELIGNFKNGGTDYRPKGDPQRVNVHDFEDKKLGKVVPYGVYDVTANAGLVSVGITSDTAEFAVASIRCWLERMGRQRYPQARELTITADCGGSNGARLRLWKVELQKLADETGLVIHVHHYPPGTSKWNKIEHRLFCHITQNWRGRPLTDRLAVVELIGATTTKTGLKVESVLDTRTYQKGIKVTNAAMKCLDIIGDQFHPEWNYTIKPRPPSGELLGKQTFAFAYRSKYDHACATLFRSGSGALISFRKRPVPESVATARLVTQAMLPGRAKPPKLRIAAAAAEMPANLNPSVQSDNGSSDGHVTAEGVRAVGPAYYYEPSRFASADGEPPKLAKPDMPDPPAISAGEPTVAASILPNPFDFFRKHKSPLPPEPDAEQVN